MEAHHFRIIDNSQLLWPSPLYPFALEDELMKQAEPGGDIIVHFWKEPSGLIIGLRDRKLPDAPAAMQELQKEGRRVVVRHSGGAAVPLDSGVLNVTFIFPSAKGNKSAFADYRGDFQFVSSFVAEALESFAQVKAGEIAGSYCPGEFDLSIEGRKFCGIAQRRTLQARAVQAFFVVEGKGESRAQAARRFYDRAALGAEEGQYPQVLPETMGSLCELAGIDSTTQFKALIAAQLDKLGNITWSKDGTEPQVIMKTVAELAARYDR
ncbi:lipoyl protein ligase domain-containing protein [Paenibacillus turpanensis]|uniref:lipoyl protein ligase domain-containing protein n=1 Tax=Paenibacillus turpanensis TaxID=2689078 RepID=UPI00140C406C|nr:lipoate--protein ligase family protein [Paenibacillus turpanensis]